MVETSAFFEAYRHNLQALQDLRDNCFPLKQYIVHVEKDVQPPKYLRLITKYDLRPLLVPFPSKPKSIHDDSKQTVFPPISEYVKELPILQPTAWPFCYDLNMENYQFKAFREALTKEFVIIQGPPGTGKTYIGLRVVQILIQNEHIWNNERESPMLIVCFTNHALDQFLEGILNITSSIVRVGGRCTSPALEEFRLVNRRLTSRNEAVKFAHIGRDKALRRNRYQCTTQLLVLEGKIKEAQSDIRRALQDILTEKDLEDIMGDDHFESLSSNSSTAAYNDGQLMLDWLELRLRGQDLDPDFNADEEEEESESELEESYVDVPEEPRDTSTSVFNPEEILFDDPQVEDIYLEDERELDEAIAKQEASSNSSERAEGDWGFTEGFVARRKKIQKQMKKYKNPMTQVEAKGIKNIWQLPIAQRWGLYHLWATIFVDSRNEMILDLQNKYDEQLQILKELRHLEDLNVMRQCSVIGMTTTGAAKFHKLVKDLKPRIVIVEEAAEVLEAHIITALSKETEHLILIGDHQQLRPNPASYSLAKDYNLNISLFERMVENHMPCQQLVAQHRMRPDIASLLVPTIYPILVNAENVLRYENIKGVHRNLFFITHTFIEGNEADSFTKSNIHEATFLIKLAEYFVKQGYKQKQITILATYSGQVFSLQNLRKQAHLEKVIVSSVDNYQGEENDIVLISLVRSNEQGSIGFLETSNRVCVALSRAKKGLFCSGNIRMLASSSDLWKQLEKKLDDMDAIGIDLRLYCQNHPDTYKDVARDSDFDSVPEGGCTRMCTYRLPCGHVCKLCCHSYDKNHENFQCKEKCSKRTCNNFQHRCPKFCFQCAEEDCGACIVRVTKELKCGHQVIIPCSKEPKAEKCPMKCTKTLNCGHLCQNQCGETCETECKTIVGKTGNCSHLIQIPCSKSRNPIELHKHCNSDCGMTLVCGHNCVGKCGKCLQGRLHAACQAKCTKLLVCGHVCKEPCASTCPPCQMKCESSCEHSTCPKVCGVPCQPCRMPCKWICPHHRCKSVCSDVCERTRCKQPCPKLLKCNHPCISYCGEPCPSACRICHKDLVTAIIFGKEDEPDARFLRLECGHIFESKGLVKMLKNQSSIHEEAAIRVPRCPTCHKIIQNNNFLNFFIKTNRKAIEKVKENVYGLQKDNDRKLKDLQVYMKSLLVKVVEHFKKPLKVIDSKLSVKNLDRGQLAAYRNFLIFIERLDKADGEVWNCHDHILNEIKVFGIPLSEQLANLQNQCLVFMTESCAKPCQQQAEDLEREVVRFENVARIVCTIHKLGGLSALTKEAKDKCIQILGKLFAPRPLIGESLQQVNDYIKGMERLYGSSRIGVSTKEKQEIVRAIGLNQGHWYQCPNGHVYCIGECGGATVVSKCNECRAQIGGQNHALITGNRLATDMDGAQYAAWSEAANLENFDPAEFL